MILLQKTDTNLRANASTRSTGFTLIELLVVIAIIGILAAVVLVNIWGSTAKARDARRVADIQQLSLALHMYYNDHGAFPDPGSSGTGEKVGDGGALEDILADYMSKVPADPLADSTHYYYYDPLHCNSGGGGYAAVIGFNISETGEETRRDTNCGAEGDVGTTGDYNIVLGPAAP